MNTSQIKGKHSDDEKSIGLSFFIAFGKIVFINTSQVEA